MAKYPISFWNTTDIRSVGAKEANMWADLGITVAMSPTYGKNDHDEMIALLDLANSHGIRVILCDPRTYWGRLDSLGEVEYRRQLDEAVAEYGSHPAVFGFFIGDEPNAPDFDSAMKAMRINIEAAPHLTPYLNLLPWFDWIGERMGTESLAPYLDRVIAEGKCRLLSYDCYAQMWGERGYDTYFHNLYEYYMAVKRHGIPFWNIVLSTGHYEYRNPSKNDLKWQLSTSVACGASGVSWFFIREPGIWCNAQTSPINELGDRTEEFGWLSEVNRSFNGYMGEIMTTLTIDSLYMTGKKWAEIPMFEPFGNVLGVSASNDVPLIFSRFHDKDGHPYYVVCVNTPYDSAYVNLKFKEGISLSSCVFGNAFSKIETLSDPVGEKNIVPGQSAGIWLAPGQLALIKED